MDEARPELAASMDEFPMSQIILSPFAILESLEKGSLCMWSDVASSRSRQARSGNFRSAALTMDAGLAGGTHLDEDDFPRPHVALVPAPVRNLL